MTYKLVLDPEYVTNEGEIIDSFLVNSDGLILEYARIQTEYGVNTTLVASRSLSSDSGEQLRDFVIAPDGTLNIYSGTFDPTLQSYNWQLPYTQNNTQTYSGWSTVNNVSYGGIDYYQNYVFVTDMKTYGTDEDQAKGIVRFSSQDEPAIRFAEQGNYIDLTVGLDNLIYGLESYGKVSVYNPENLELVRSFTLQDKYNNYRGIAVNEQGEIFSAAWDGNIYYFNPDGNIVDVNSANTSGVIDLNTNNFYDINISPDGRELIASDRNGLIALLSIKNQYLELQDVFPTGGNSAFVSFGTSSNIVNDNPIPQISISDAEVVEWGEFEPARLNFTVSLDQATNEMVQVDVGSFIPWGAEYDSQPQNFADYSDVAMMSQMLTFAPGETEQIFSLEVFDDWLEEANEQVYVEALVISDNATIADGLGVGTIIDDDLMPVISISDAQMIEGDYEDYYDAPPAMEFTVSLNAPAFRTVAVDLNIVDYPLTILSDPALIYQDFYPMYDWMNLTFEPGETQKTIAIEINPDDDAEFDEQFAVEITSAYGAVVGDGLGIGTILDDDSLVTNDNPIPQISISDAEVVEWGEFEPARLNFTVSLDQATNEMVQVDVGSFIPWGAEYDSQPQNFADYSDVAMMSQMLTFAPGETEKIFSLEVFDDWFEEANEQVYVEALVISDNATIADGLGVGTIIDDDLMPTVSISDAQMIEGDYEDYYYYDAPPAMEFTVSLNTPAFRTVAVDLNIVDYPLTILSDPALIYQDFYPMYDWMNLNFEPGETQKTIAIEINPDDEYEPKEQFAVEITSAYGAVVGDGLGIGTIIDDDFKPVISISDAEVLEGDEYQSTWMDFTVSLSGAFEETVEVDVHSFIPIKPGYSEPAADFADYNDVLLTEEMIIFEPGETEKIFSVEVVGDLELEADEKIHAEVGYVLSDNATIGRDFGIGTILDNEARKPRVSINDAIAIEGTALEFSVELNQAAEDYITVYAGVNSYINDNDTANFGEDYWSYGQSLTFAPGETSLTLSIETNYDLTVEGDEQFTVEVFPESENVVIQDNIAIGTIADNDVVIGEVGHVEGIDHFEQQIQFQHQYQNPVVIVSPLSRNGGDPAIARITDIQADGFSVFLQEPTLIKQQTNTGKHILEDFSYMVMEAGTWTMPDGTAIEIGSTEVDAYTRSANWDSLELSHDFNAPVVISSVQTYNNEELIRLRQRNESGDTLGLALEKEEALLRTDYASETVGYIAVESGKNYLMSEDMGQGISYAAGDTGRTVNHRWQDLGLNDHPYLFAATNSYYGGDSVGLRSHMGSIMLDEDTSKDNEIGHTRENVAYLGFDNLGTITTEVWEF